MTGMAGAAPDADATATAGGSEPDTMEPDTEIDNEPEPEPEPCDGACNASECCDGVCVELDSAIDHCGSCGNTCSFADAAASCDAGSCSMGACSAGYLDCNGEPDDGCELEDLGLPMVPAPLKPAIGAFTGSLHARDTIHSLRPTFSWSAIDPAGCGSVSYQLQVDDSCPVTGFEDCAFSTPEIDAADIGELHYQPEAHLPVEEAAAPVGSRYFWRVRACDDAERCSEWSSVRYLDVGRLKEDINGDGYGELVGPAYGDQIHIAEGSASFGSSDVQYSARYQSAYHDEYVRPRFLGDVNGDGFNDVAFPAGYQPEELQVRLFLGGSNLNSLDIVPLPLLPRPTAGAHSTVTPVGDFDVDGFADALIGLAWSTDEPDYVALYRGDSTLEFLSNERWDALGSNTSGYAQQSTYGDFNGDGFVDFVLARPEHNLLDVFYGGSAPDLEPDATLSYGADRVCGFGGSLATLDWNGDGLDDIAALCHYEGRIDVYLGGTSFETSESITGLPTSTYDMVAGDLDGDGYGDLLVSGLRVYRGDRAATEGAIFQSASLLDVQKLAIGDHNGDGYLDVVADLEWFRGNGSFAFASSAQLSAPEFPSELQSFAR
jgi:hypothetical protein